MSDGLSIGNISLGLNDTRNIDSQVSMPKVDRDDLQALPTSFYSSEKGSFDYSSPMINEFAGLGDLSISSDISSGISSSGINISMTEKSGGASPAGFEGQGASFRPETVDSTEKIRQMAQLFSDL